MLRRIYVLFPLVSFRGNLSLILEYAYKLIIYVLLSLVGFHYYWNMLITIYVLLVLCWF